MNNYEIAKEMYAKLGIDTDVVLKELEKISISIHCWQGDDVGGFEQKDTTLTGGIQATGNYMGKAKSLSQLRDDIKKVLSLVGGNHRLSLHANYLDSQTPVERNNIQPKHFESWVAYARENKIGLDFNPTLFSHPLTETGFTLSSNDKAIRDFWIEHCIASREIADYMGKELNDTTVTNLWIPDGFKDTPIDRLTPRRNLENSLDKIFAKETPNNIDSVESKVFGIGSESCVIGSHEFYMGYAVKNQKYLTLDTGHFHPTEVVSNKITGVIDFVPGILLHTSRPIRWDSDHVVTLDDELQLLFAEIARNDLFGKIKIGLDFFDASINRIAAWVIGIRNTQKAILIGLLEPTAMLKEMEKSYNYTERLAYLEELKAMPWMLVWEEFLKRNNVPSGLDWIGEVKKYENDVLSKR